MPVDITDSAREILALLETTDSLTTLKLVALWKGPAKNGKSLSKVYILHGDMVILYHDMVILRHDMVILYDITS